MTTLPKVDTKCTALSLIQNHNKSKFKSCPRVRYWCGLCPIVLLARAVVPVE
jgi:hypothetical protein